MSFAETHKRWLLPTLGTALLAVAWMNLPGGSAGAPPKPAPRQTPTEPVPMPEPGPAEAVGTASLGDPPSALADAAPLLLAGRMIVGAELRRPPRPATLHPGQWAGLYQAPAPPATARAAAAPPPAPDFILEAGGRREVWMKGRPYRPGDTLEGGYVLKTVAASGIVAAGPGGDLKVPLRAARPTPKPTNDRGTP